MTLFFRDRLHNINNIINGEHQLPDEWQVRFANGDPGTLEIFNTTYSDNKAASELAASREVSIRAADAAALQESKAESADEKESLDAMIVRHHDEINRVVAGDVHYDIYHDITKYMVPEGVFCWAGHSPVMWTRGNIPSLQMHSERVITAGTTRIRKPLSQKLLQKLLQKPNSCGKPLVYAMHKSQLYVYSIGGKPELIHDFGLGLGGELFDVVGAAMIGACVYVLTNERKIIELSGENMRTIIHNKDEYNNLTLDTDGKSLFIHDEWGTLDVWRPDLNSLKEVMRNIPEHDFMSIGETNVIIDSIGNVRTCDDNHAWLYVRVPKTRGSNAIYADVVDSTIRVICRLANGGHEIFRSSNRGRTWDKTVLNPRPHLAREYPHRIGKSHVLVGGMCVDLVTCSEIDNTPYGTTCVCVSEW